MNENKQLQAGVIGGNWGRVHVAGLRRAGCHVTALVAHDTTIASTIAAEEQIPDHGSDIAILRSCDLVTIATPTATHLDFLQRFSALDAIPFPNEVVACQPCWSKWHGFQS